MQNDQDLGITVSAKDEASAKLKEVNGNLQTVTKSGQDLADKVKKAGLAIAGVGAGLTAYSKMATNSTVDYVKSVGQISRVTGMAADDTSRLLFAFEHFGISTGEAAATLGIFSKQIVNANDKSSDAAKKQADLTQKINETENKIKTTTDTINKNGDANGTLAIKIQGLNKNLGEYKDALNNAGSPLAALGVATKTADGVTRPFNDILLDVADKFKAMPNGAEKTALAMQLFGRSGKDLLPVLNEGRAGIAQLGAEADKLGLTLTAGNLGAVKGYIQAQKDLKASQQALTVQIGLAAIPMWEKLTTVTNQAITKLLQAPQPIRGIATGFIAMGGPVLTATGGLIGFLANLDQAAPALLRMVGVLRIAGAALLGPWGVALAAAAVATAAIIGLIHRHTSAQHDDEIATGGLSKAIELQGKTIQEATKTVHDALFDQKGATIDVMQAQQNYNQALAEFGPNSVEALSAAHELEGAKDRLKDADDKAAAAQQNLVNWEQMLPVQTGVVTAAIDFRSGAYNRLSGIVLAVTNQAQNLDNIIVTANGRSLSNISLGLQAVSTQATNVQKAVSAITSSGISFQGASVNIQGTVHRASGGPVTAGQPYIVGENRPELFVPDQSGYIYPDASKAAGGRKGQQIIQNNNIFNQVDLNQVVRDLAWRLQRA